MGLSFFSVSFLGSSLMMFYLEDLIIRIKRFGGFIDGLNYS